MSLHKGWLAFGVEIDSFCERETTPIRASIHNVGMASLLSSKLYGNAASKWNFIGFSSQPQATDPCTTTPTVQATVSTPLSTGDKEIAGLGNDGSSTVKEDGTCRVGIVAYQMGVFGHISGDNYIGYQIGNNGVIVERAEHTHVGNNMQAGLDTTCT